MPLMLFGSVCCVIRHGRQSLFSFCCANGISQFVLRSLFELLINTANLVAAAAACVLHSAMILLAASCSRRNSSPPSHPPLSAPFRSKETDSSRGKRQERSLLAHRTPDAQPPKPRTGMTSSSLTAKASLPLRPTQRQICH